jgi:hypothetical protein
MNDAAKTVTQDWYSGEWLATPRSDPPYNGLHIQASYVAGDNKLKVTFYDYTTDVEGVSVTTDMFGDEDGWINIPQPESQSDGGKVDFTVQGRIRIQKEANGDYLRIRLSYGIKYRGEELGFIMRVFVDE